MKTGVLAVVSALVVAPIVLVVLSAFKTPAEFAGSSPWSPPTAWTLTAFARALAEGGMAGAMGRSALVIAFLLLTQFPLSILAGYAFAWGRFPGRRVLYTAVVATLVVPGIALVMPLYLMTAAAGLRETFWGLVLPWSLGSAFAVVLLTAHFRSLSPEQIDAARVDGAGELRILLSVVIPQSLPVLGVLSAVTAITHWNSYLWPQVIAGSQWPTATVAALSLRGQYTTDWTAVLAGCVLMVVPALGLFVVIQRSWAMLVSPPTKVVAE